MSNDRRQSLASGQDSIAHHVSELLPLPSDQRDRYLGALDQATAEELRELLAFESSAVDLSELAGVTVAQELLRREVPPNLGRWRVQRPLGQGGMGSVYLVTREELGIVHEGAAKRGHSQIQSAAALAAVQREAGALSGLQHGNIARLLDFGADEQGLPFVVSEYVEGTALLSYLSSRRLDRNRRLALFEQLLNAVIAAHANLVLHLDLKPDNVLVTDSGQVKLIDFGLSGLGGERPAGFTQAYASPEQLAGQPVTVAADIYALGKILELIVSCEPSVGSAELAAIVEMATRADPRERYPSVLALKLDIQALQARRPVTPLAQRRLYRWSRFLRRQWLPTSLAALTVAILVAGLLSVHRQNQAIEQERDRALELLASERATSSFVTLSLREASVFAGGDGQMTVAELMHSMLENLPAEEDMSPRSKSWLASDLAAVFTGLGEMDAALAASEMAVASAERSEELEDDIAHWTQRALTAGVAHRYELALEAAETARALALSVDHWRLPWTYLATMQTLVAMKRWTEVVDLFDVIESLPTDRQSVRGNIHYMRGIALTGLERFTEAAADFAAAHTIYGEVFGADSAPVADVQFRDYQRLIQQGELDEANQRTATLTAFFADSYGAAHYRSVLLAAEQSWLDYLTGVSPADTGLSTKVAELRSLLGDTSPVLAIHLVRLAQLNGQQASPDLQAAKRLLDEADRRLAVLPYDNIDRLESQLTRAELAWAVDKRAETAERLAALNPLLGLPSSPPEKGGSILRLRFLLLSSQLSEGREGRGDDDQLCRSAQRVLARSDSHWQPLRAMGPAAGRAVTEWLQSCTEKKVTQSFPL